MPTATLPHWTPATTSEWFRAALDYGEHARHCITIGYETEAGYNARLAARSARETLQRATPTELHMIRELSCAAPGRCSHCPTTSED